MNLELIIYGDLHQRSGGYLYDRQMVEYLRQQGDQVRVISLPQRAYLANWLHNWRRSSGEADLVLQDELCHPSLTCSNQRTDRPPVVAILHHLRANEGWPAWQAAVYRYLEGRYLRTVDAVICTSHRTCADLSTLTNGGKPSLVAQPGGDHLRTTLTDQDVWRRAQHSDVVRIVFVGNLIPRKGLHHLLEALAALETENWELTVVGSQQMDPAYSRAIRRHILRLGLDGRVHLTGALSHEQVAEQLRDSHVLAVPSNHEGFGIAYLEGMGFGLPAIASSSGGAVDIVQEGENGFLVPPEDVETLRSRLEALLGSPELIARMGVSALQSHAQHPTWAMSGRRVREFLVERLDKGKELR